MEERKWRKTKITPRRHFDVDRGLCHDLWLKTSDRNVSLRFSRALQAAIFDGNHGGSICWHFCGCMSWIARLAEWASRQADKAELLKRSSQDVKVNGKWHRANWKKEYSKVLKWKQKKRKVNENDYNCNKENIWKKCSSWN